MLPGISKNTMHNYSVFSIIPFLLHLFYSSNEAIYLYSNIELELSVNYCPHEELSSEIHSTIIFTFAENLIEMFLFCIIRNCGRQLAFF